MSSLSPSSFHPFQALITALHLSTMLFSRTLIIAAVQCLVAVAAPTEEAARLTKRDGMTVHKAYNIAGWVATCGQYVEQQFTGTAVANNRLPIDQYGMSLLSQTVTEAILDLPGNGDLGEVIGNVAGGWQYGVELLQDNVDFYQIPYTFLRSVIFDALVASAEFPLFTENSFMFILNDAGGHGLLQLAILPTVRGALKKYHDEF